MDVDPAGSSLDGTGGDPNPRTSKSAEVATPTPPSPARRRRLVIGALGVVVLAMVGGYLVMGTGGGVSAPAGASTPEEAVDAFLAAGDEADCDGMHDVVTDEFLAGMSREASLEQCNGNREEWTSWVRPMRRDGRGRVRGLEATVVVREHGQPDDFVMHFVVVERGGQWRLDDIEYPRAGYEPAS